MSRRHRRTEGEAVVRLGYGPVGGGVLADTDLEFYADESGNTSANHLDQTQPFYVTGGWLVRPPDADRARASVLAARRLMEASELSGPRLLKSGKGRKVALKFVATLMNFCTPVLVIVEKRFALGIRIGTELLRLPFSTPASRDPSARAAARNASRVLSELPDDALDAANEFAKKPGAAAARRCLELIVASARGDETQELVAAAAERLRTLSKDWRSDPAMARSLSPNVMGFTTLAQCLELLGRRCGRSIALVHDEIPFLQDVYEFYQGLARDAGTIAPHSEFFARAGCPGLIEHVSLPDFRDSAAEPLVEGADVLVGMVSTLLTTIDGKGKWKPNELPLAAFLLGGFIEPVLRSQSLFHFVGSDATGLRMGQAVVDAIGFVVPG